MTSTAFESIFNLSQIIASELGYVEDDGFDGLTFFGADRSAVLQIEDVVTGEFRVVVVTWTGEETSEDDEELDPTVVWERRFQMDKGRGLAGLLIRVNEALVAAKEIVEE